MAPEASSSVNAEIYKQEIVANIRRITAFATGPNWLLAKTIQEVGVREEEEEGEGEEATLLKYLA